MFRMFSSIPSWIKPKTIKLKFAASPLSTQHWGGMARTGWLGIMMSRSRIVPTTISIGFKLLQFLTWHSPDIGHSITPRSIYEHLITLRITTKRDGSNFPPYGFLLRISLILNIYNDKNNEKRVLWTRLSNSGAQRLHSKRTIIRTQHTTLFWYRWYTDWGL